LEFAQHLVKLAVTDGETIPKQVVQRGHEGVNKLVGGWRRTETDEQNQSSRRMPKQGRFAGTGVAFSSPSARPEIASPHSSAQITSSAWYLSLDPQR
jgi:hypothetical protein